MYYLFIYLFIMSLVHSVQHRIILHVYYSYDQEGTDGITDQNPPLSAAAAASKRPSNTCTQQSASSTNASISHLYHQVIFVSSCCCAVNSVKCKYALERILCLFVRKVFKFIHFRSNFCVVCNYFAFYFHDCVAVSTGKLRYFI